MLFMMDRYVLYPICIYDVRTVPIVANFEPLLCYDFVLRFVGIEMT